jgi:Tol biopolymer transport system component
MKGSRIIKKGGLEMSGRTKRKLKKLARAAIIGLSLTAGLREADAYEITQLTFQPSYEGQPAWSPDGSKIAFVSDRDGNREIYVMDANGTNEERLTYNPDDDIEPDWSPDGSKIAFSSNLKGDYDIWLMNADGSDQLALTSDSRNERAPAWRYNENRILYHDPYWDGTIYIMNADGSSQTALANGRWPSWSPDRKKIVFSSNKHGGGPEIYIMNHNGSDERRLTSNCLLSSEPAWSPIGTKIVFSIAGLSVSPEFCYFPDLYMMDNDGSNLERLTFDGYKYYCLFCGFLRRSPTWSRDGTKIAYDYKGDIWVLSGVSVREKTLHADLNNDGIVDFLDLSILASRWLMTESWYKD